MNPIDEEKKKREGESPSSVSGNVIASQQTSIEAPAKPGSAAAGIMSGASVGASRPAIYAGQPATGNIYNQPPSTEATATKLPAEVVQAGIEKMRGQMATPQTPAVAQPAQTPPQTAPQTAPQNTEYKPGILATTREWAHSGVPLGDFIRGSRDGSKPAPTPAPKPAAASAAGQASQPAVASYSNEGRAVPTQNSNPVVVPPPGPEYPNITPTNLSAANESLAKANAIRQSMIDSQSAVDQTKGPSGGIIEDKNKTDREALFAKWDRENMVQKVANMNPRNAAAVAALLGSGDRAASEQAQTAAVRRGQDFTRESQSANAAVANREVANRERMTTADSQLRAAQSKGIMSGVDKDAQISALQTKAAAGDKAALETLQAMRGKGERSRDRYITMPNRKVYNDMGQIVGEEPGGIFDAETGSMVKQGPAKTSAPPEALAFLKKNPAQAEAFKAKYGYLPDGF